MVFVFLCLCALYLETGKGYKLVIWHGGVVYYLKEQKFKFENRVSTPL